MEPRVEEEAEGHDVLDSYPLVSELQLQLLSQH